MSSQSEHGSKRPSIWEVADLAICILGLTVVKSLNRREEAWIARRKMGILNENKNDIESTALTVSRFSSVEAIEQSTRQLGRSMQVNQLEKSPIEICSTSFSIGQIRYVMRQISKKIESFGEFPDGVMSFHFPMGNHVSFNALNITTDGGVAT